MPRRTHTPDTRHIFDSYATYEALYEELHKQWARWRQQDNERANAIQQEKRIDQFRQNYIN